MKTSSVIVLLATMANAEAHKLLSDPICSSSGCTQYKHPKKDLGYKIDYSVPSFGRDTDLNTQNSNVDLAEGILKHTWTPTRADKKDKGDHIWGSDDNRWVVPTAGSDFFLTGDDKDYMTNIHGINWY